GKNKRRRPGASVIAGMRQRRWQLLELLVAEILPSYKTAEHHPRIQRVRRDVAVFVPGVHWPPSMKIQRAVLAAAWRGRRTTVLLRNVHPVRKLVVGHNMIELRRGRGVSRATRLTACAL